MPLDGRDYGAQAFIPPIYAHPRAAALGDGLAGSLQASYSHLRTNARLVSHTTFPQRVRSFFGFTVGPTTWARIARSIPQLPYVATHILARIALHSAPGTVRGRIQITDGTNTDEATTLHTVPEGDRSPDLYFTLAHPDDPAFQQVEWVCPIVDARVVSGMGQRTITVEAYAFDGASNPIVWAPSLVSLHWVAVG